jgi:hypothetical protein
MAKEIQPDCSYFNREIREEGFLLGLCTMPQKHIIQGQLTGSRGGGEVNQVRGN